jgi:hypothetical protein
MGIWVCVYAVLFTPSWKRSLSVPRFKKGCDDDGKAVFRK